MNTPILTLLLVLGLCYDAARADVLTQHYDTGRSGATLHETRLTTSNVNSKDFGKLYSLPVDGHVYSQPLYVEGLAMPGLGRRNVLFVATMHNSVYAFDADARTVAPPLWQVTLETSSSLPDSNIGSACVPYQDIFGEVGINGTPVIDRASETLYVVTFTRSGPAGSAQANYAHWLHALDLKTGRDRPGGPRLIEAQVPGSGVGSIGGMIALQSQFEIQRAALLLANGEVYVGFGAYCDSGPYHGWLLAYDASDLSLRATFNVTPDGDGGGIWQAGQGPTLDASGNIYVMTGNGTTTVQNGGSSLSSALIKLSPQLAVLDWFVPHNFQELNDSDGDLGSSGVLLLPGADAVVGGGKEGKLYVLDQNALGHYHQGSDSQILQSWQASYPPADWTGHIHGSPVYWNSSDGPLIYVWPENDFLRAYSYADSRFDTTPRTLSTMRAAPGMPGGMLAVSADGAKSGSGIVWSSMPLSADANHAVVPGIVRAFDAENLGNELWNSELDPARDSLGNYAKFCEATVVKGRVFLPNFSGQVAVYGLRSRIRER